MPIFSMYFPDITGLILLKTPDEKQAIVSFDVSKEMPHDIYYAGRNAERGPG